MKKLVIAFFFLIWAGLIGSCNYDTFTSSDKEFTGYRYYYVNGMQTDFTEAIADKKELYRAMVEYKDSHPDEHIFDDLTEDDVRLAFNYDETSIDDIFEAFLQKNFDTFQIFFVFPLELPMPNFIEDPYEEMVDDYILKTVSNILKSPSDDLRKHIRYYEKDLKEGKKIVLIGHSQGNFYANEAYDYLQSNDVGVVAVATPADRVGKDIINAPYTTFYQDEVINTVRFFYPDLWSLPPNMSADTCDSSTCHNFVRDYLSPDNASRTKIVRDIIRVAKDL